MDFHEHSLTTTDFKNISRYSYFPWMDTSSSSSQVNPVAIELNRGIFYVQDQYTRFQVMVVHQPPVTTVFCNCSQKGFCSHQKATLTKLFGQESWLSFFDSQRYGKLLQKVASQYGLEN